MSWMRRPSVVGLLVVASWSLACTPSSDPPSEAEASMPGSGIADLAEDYLTAYFAMFPSRATAAGRREGDTRLETLTAAKRQAWVETNRTLIAGLEDRLAGGVPLDDQLDAELLIRQARRQIDTFATRDRPAHDPLFWTGVLGNATVFLLVRDDQPLPVRLDAAAARARQIPRVVDEARAALDPTPDERLAPELVRLAARQARASAGFYRGGFAVAAGEDAERRAALHDAGAQAASALEAFADHLEARAERATGSPRLGDAYATTFAIATGIATPLDAVLADAEAALQDKRREAAAYGRQVWPSLMAGAAPDDDVDLLRRLFARVSEDAATDVDAFVEDYRTLIDAAIDFVRAHNVVTLPEPLTLHTDRSPSYFVGQSVGGVYAAGPYAPEADTLFYLPSPPDDASAEMKAAFFRDFNHHFNVMITPHELVPGHYFQLKMAARHPRKVRALFGDGVYIEGWGTFCERLMLDLGWGDELARLAHLKKQLENIARTIVDIRVHTRGMTRDEVLTFVRDEALQDAQFAGNMWTRSITSAPQLTSYYLGYREVMSLYQDVRAAQGDDFVLKAFMDGMMTLGPVPVRHYRERMLGSAVADP